ncbi:MAG: tail fiber domain-containing protein [Planctomycetota bacterium]|nr:tail fiber domain-containing protein [Planctomycetota bacterium]
MYREFSTTPATGSEQFLFENLRMENLSQVLGGVWPVWFPNPEGPTEGLITQMSSQGAHTILAAPQEFLMADGTNMNRKILTSRENWLAASQFIVDVDGKMYWGNGNGATDIDVARTAVGELTFTGDLVANSFNPPSSREKKTDIDRLTESECREILEKIERTDLYSYRFKKDPSSGKKGWA